MIRRRHISVLITGLLTVGLTGCSDDMSDLQAYIDEVNARKSSDIDPIPEPKPYQPYTYVPGERRDPFTPPKRTERPRQQTGSGPQPDLNRAPEPLEEFPIDGLRMVGTIGFGGDLKALIKASDGAIYTVRPGNYVGRNDGKILKITSSEIEIRELIPDGFGAYQERIITLSVSEDGS